MRLDRLADVELSYVGPFAFVVPFADEGGSYGVGEGTFTGERLSGHVRFSNRAHKRSDGVLLPAFEGAIATDDGATILLQLWGRVVDGRQTLLLLLETDAERYRWLNDAVCIFEGSVDHSSGVIRGRAYVCVNEAGVAAST